VLNISFAIAKRFFSFSLSTNHDEGNPNKNNTPPANPKNTANTTLGQKKLNASEKNNEEEECDEEGEEEEK